MVSVQVSEGMRLLEWRLLEDGDRQLLSTKRLLLLEVRPKWCAGLKEFGQVGLRFS